VTKVLSYAELKLKKNPDFRSLPEIKDPRLSELDFMRASNVINMRDVVSK
jgi:hypothetical protein